MEPNHNNYIPSNELPAAQREPTQSGEKQHKAAAPETSGNKMPHIQPAATVPQQSPQASVPIPSDTASTSVSSGIPISSTLIADDADLIEKEWVFKAKAIVAQTKNDPYMQNKEITKVKAEYLKKRYNKDIKVSEE